MLNYSWKYGKKRHYKHTNVCFAFFLISVVAIIWHNEFKRRKDTSWAQPPRHQALQTTLSLPVLQLGRIVLLHYLCHDLAFFWGEWICWSFKTGQEILCLTFGLQGFQGMLSDLGYSWTLGRQLVLLNQKSFKLHRADLKRFPKIESTSELTIQLYYSMQLGYNLSHE